MRITSKAKIRRDYVRRRQALTAEDRRLHSQLIAGRLLDLRVFQEAHTIMAYVDFRAEVETGTLLEEVLERGKRLVLPKVQPRGLLACLRVTDTKDDLVAGRHGILEPRSDGTIAVCPREIDLVVVPGVAFTRYGYRLGYGGGYYDRFLAQEAPGAVAIGLAFEVQMAECLPVESHDRPVDMVITESGVYT